MKVSFYSNGGTDTEVQYVQSGRTVEIPEVSRTGYTLDGWYTSLDQGATFDEKWSLTENVVSNNITLICGRIVKSIYNFFDTNGASPIVSITQDYLTLINSPNDPWREGFPLTGGFLDAEMWRNLIFFKQCLAANLVLYAKWLEKSVYGNFMQRQGLYFKLM
ncbi:MAG: InlB B-repeat-containing protein [Bacillus subtilis]|nr:InlB B-repeat-containing protein [Bacillus subtilis]